GDSYLANLTCKSRISTDLTPYTILSSTNSPFAFYIPDRFLSFSPERFVKVENGIISSFPMKGTIDATLPDAEERILNNYKESCEHATITDLIRNDIGMVSENVWVERYRYIDKISTDRGEILQVSSDIRGRIKPEYTNSLGSLIMSLLPAGSISGAPKRSTVELISKAELLPRGFYTGVAGFFDGKILDSAVLIRYIEFDSYGNMFYRSGGGITINSNVEEEYSEMINKIYLPLNR
ncbi:MAG: aminodeoxychorismate synthase component I, partial [Bacteroidales bacterium]